MVLHDTKFPDDLAEHCKEFTGHATCTGAVRETCARALEMQHDIRAMRLQIKDYKPIWMMRGGWLRMIFAFWNGKRNF